MLSPSLRFSLLSLLAGRKHVELDSQLPSPTQTATSVLSAADTADAVSTCSGPGATVAVELAFRLKWTSPGSSLLLSNGGQEEDNDENEDKQSSAVPGQPERRLVTGQRVGVASSRRKLKLLFSAATGCELLTK